MTDRSLSCAPHASPTRLPAAMALHGVLVCSPLQLSPAARGRSRIGSGAFVWAARVMTADVRKTPGKGTTTLPGETPPCGTVRKL